MGHSVLQNNRNWTLLLLLENWESWSQLIYIQWSVTVGFISSASVGHGTNKLASWPFVMMYEHVIHTICWVGQNYNEAPVFSSKSVQTI